MSGRSAFALLALALFGVGFTIYAVIASTPFFPKALQTEFGVCPPSHDYPAERRPVIEDYEAEWYSSSLLGLHEEPLFEDKDKARQTVRFTLLRSFHVPVTIRTTEMEDGRVRLAATWPTGYDGCPTSEGVCRVDRVLSEAEQTRLAAAQRFLLKPSYGCPSGVDGSMWLVEASGRGDYRFWSEWSPQDGELRDLALLMLDLTGWRLQDIY